MKRFAMLLLLISLVFAEEKTLHSAGQAHKAAPKPKKTKKAPPKAPPTQSDEHDPFTRELQQEVLKMESWHGPREFSILPPKTVAGLQPTQIAVKAEQTKWTQLGISGRLSFSSRPEWGFHTLLAVQDIPAGQTAGSRSTKTILRGGKIGWTSNGWLGNGPDLSEANNDHIVKPVLSPDGRYVLFSLGTEGYYLAYDFRLLDTVTDRIIKLPTPKMANPSFDWSSNSKYITYLSGGNRDGFPYLPGDPSYTGRMGFIVMDLQTKKEYIVAGSDSYGARFITSWHDDDCYFSTLEDDSVGLLSGGIEAERVRKIIHKGKYPRPSLYKFSMKTKRAQFVAFDAYRPAVSPDGKWIVFHGCDPKNPYPLKGLWQYESHDASLCLMNADGSGRRVLNREPFVYAEVDWLPDSRHFLTYEPTKGSPNFEGEVKEWDVETGLSRLVCKVAAKDFEATPYDQASPRLQPLGVSADGQHAYFAIEKYTGLNSDLYLGAQTLNCLDLQSGEYFPFAIFDMGAYYSWREVRK